MLWWTFLRREWRDLSRGGAVRWLLLLGGALAALALLPPDAAAPAWMALLVPLALGGTARRVWRERRRGVLDRIALSPMGVSPVLLAWGLSRLAVLALLALPPLVLTWLRLAAGRGVTLGPGTAGGWGNGPEPSLALAGLVAPPPEVSPVALLLALAVPLSLLFLLVAVGVATGLSCRRWSHLHLTIALASALGILLLLGGGVPGLVAPVSLVPGGAGPTPLSRAGPAVAFPGLLAGLIFLLAPLLIREE